MVALRSRCILLPSLLQVRFSPMTDLVVAASVPRYQLDCGHTAQMFVKITGSADTTNTEPSIVPVCHSYPTVSKLIFSEFLMYLSHQLIMQLSRELSAQLRDSHTG